MNFTSTRNNRVSVSSARAIEDGMSRDGGLYLPDSIPYISEDKILRLLNKSYQERAAAVLSSLLSDFSYNTLLQYAKKSYSASSFTDASPAPVVDIGDNIYVLELFHGPTAAFKDMALQMLPLLLTESMRIEGIKEDILILTATSGDTGSAAMTGFSDVDRTHICVFYPQGGTSLLQRMQMTTQSGKNVLAFAVKGNFDDAQRGVKSIFTDKNLNSRLKENGLLLSSANSINFGRLAPQIVYYFSAYLDLIAKGKIKFGDIVDVCVPSGNFGNILSAFYAKKMGVPLGKLICASNLNNVLFDFINTGIYDKNRPFYKTISPSMDILVSSNLERLLYLLSEKNDILISELMKALNSCGRYEVPEFLSNKIKEEFASYWADEQETKIAIRDVFHERGYLADTHTAVGLSAIAKYRKESATQKPIIAVATASPFKFPKTVLDALNFEIPQNEFEMLEILEAKTKIKAPLSLSALRNKKERFIDSVDKNEMAEVLKKFLK